MISSDALKNRPRFSPPFRLRYYCCLLFVLQLCFPTGLRTGAAAQGLAGVKNLDRAILFQVGYGVYTSGADLSDRFGGGFALDGGISYLLPNSNWQFGLRGHFGFGSNVKEDVLAGLRTADGFIIGNMRAPADVGLKQRYLFVGPSAGYTFRIGGNQRSGIHLRTAVGYLGHWIKIQGDPGQGVQPLLDERLAGYDRLTGGPTIHQFIGYQLLGRDQTLNFFIGTEVLAGFTRNRRAFDVPTGGPPPDGRRLDLLLGARAGIIVPLYAGEGREIFYK